ncbi:hypothetical protein IFM89_020955 [Coptis chinensis]|uniref:Uncharacterized protein n=1 Tax=Coptis chinensis TaxID=261450 RepID=A0A835M090_9MAGN|nr:hypothetical protein IFM89_020955 [Coptis chinensis]
MLTGGEHLEGAPILTEMMHAGFGNYFATKRIQDATAVVAHVSLRRVAWKKIEEGLARARTRTAIREVVRTRNYTSQKEVKFYPQRITVNLLKDKSQQHNRVTEDGKETQDNLVVEFGRLGAEEVIKMIMNIYCDWHLAHCDGEAMEIEKTIPKETMVEKVDEDKEFVVRPKRRIGDKKLATTAKIAKPTATIRNRGQTRLKPKLITDVLKPQRANCQAGKYVFSESESEDTTDDS